MSHYSEMLKENRPETESPYSVEAISESDVRLAGHVFSMDETDFGFIEVVVYFGTKKQTARVYVSDGKIKSATVRASDKTRTP